VSDMDRAKNFYETVFDVTISVQDFGGVLMGFFPSEKEASGAKGSLIKYESYVPSEEGVLIYFGSDDVQIQLDNIIDAGGTIQREKTQISPEHGYMAVFVDTEGNRIALHSQQ